MMKRTTVKFASAGILSLALLAAPLTGSLMAQADDARPAARAVADEEENWGWLGLLGLAGLIGLAGLAKRSRHEGVHRTDTVSATRAPARGST